MSIKRINQLLILFLLVFSSCSGSDTYRGKWKATNPEGKKFEIEFLPKNFKIKDEAGDSSNFAYTQHSVEIKNFVETYGIKLNDGRTYSIHFPIASDESVGVMIDGAGNPVYTISRNEYKMLDEIYKLK